MENSSPPKFRVVPDALRDSDIRGRPITSPISKALLEGKTVFVTDVDITWGSIYQFAKNHGKRAHVKARKLNDEIGYVIWFDDDVEAT